MTALWYCIFSHLFRPDSTSPLQSWMVWSMFWVERTKTLRSSSRWRCLTPIAMFGEYNQKWPQCAKWGLALFCTNPHTLTAILSCFSHFVSLFSVRLLCHHEKETVCDGRRIVWEDLWLCGVLWPQNPAVDYSLPSSGKEVKCLKGRYSFSRQFYSKQFINTHLKSLFCSQSMSSHQNEDCWTLTHSQTIQHEDFVSSSEQIWRNLALHHLLTNGPSAVNGCRQNESQTADKNIKIIHK